MRRTSRIFFSPCWQLCQWWFPKQKWGGVGGWVETYPIFFWIFFYFFNFAKPLSLTTVSVRGWVSGQEFGMLWQLLLLYKCATLMKNTNYNAVVLCYNCCEDRCLPLTKGTQMLWIFWKESHHEMCDIIYFIISDVEYVVRSWSSVYLPRMAHQDSNE